MRKAQIIIGILFIAILLVPGGCAPAFTANQQPQKFEVKIKWVNIGDYRVSYDPQGEPELKATFSWETNKPCYYWFEVKPTDQDYPLNSVSIRQFDVDQPLLQQVVHHHEILLLPSRTHSYCLVVWDRQKNYARAEDNFTTPPVPSKPPPSEPPSKYEER